MYVADTLNGRVRVIDPDGAHLDARRQPAARDAPSRLAYHPAGWLYVKDASSTGVTARAVSPSALMPNAHLWLPALAGSLRLKVGSR